MILYLLIVIFISAAALSLILRSTRAIRLLGMATSVTVAALITWLTLSGATGLSSDAAALWYIDNFTLFMLGILAVVYVSAMLSSVRYLKHEEEDGIIDSKQVRLYYGLAHIFAATMVVALCANNLGVLWIAIEGTTLSTTLLVSFYKKKSSIEAAWKYIVLCSLGISFGLIGILMLADAGTGAGLGHWSAFSLAALRNAAPEFATGVVRWAFVFIFLGIGTKVGLFPMHTWLPDAHSKTPSPISGLLSGMLLNVALASLLRLKQVTDLALGSSGWTEQFFLIFGVMTVVFAAFALVGQRNYKRLLAYSSIEHMGLACFAIGLGPWGVIPALIHMAGHSAAKSGLFFGAGEILSQRGTTNMEKIRGLWKTAPLTSGLFIALLMMLLAVPPSLLFISEIFMVGYGLQTYPWLVTLVLIALTVAAVSMVRHILMIVLDTGDGLLSPRMHREAFNENHLAMIILLVILTAFGLAITLPQVMDYITQIAKSIVSL